jgi:GAF domain-containing protein
MGERAAELFAQALALGGIAAKVRLASLARVTSAEAQAGADDPAVLERLRSALERLRPEFPASKSPLPAAQRLETDRTAVRLRLQLETFLDLMTQRALVFDSFPEAARRVTEAAATGLSVGRASVWLLDAAEAPSEKKLVCVDLFDAKQREHSAGLELFSADFGPYFEAMLSERAILAADARTDPRTSCFEESYLVPLGIGAMLDVPIWVAGDLTGVICCEHLGATRSWDADDERFGHLLSSLLGLALEGRARSSMG